MKRLFMVVMLLLSIAAELCAQPLQKSADPMEIPGNIVINRRFYMRFEHGNSVKAEATDFTDIIKVKNTDSLLQLFLQDLNLLKDSLQDQLSAKHIEYFCDAAGRRKIRIRQSHGAGTAFLIGREEDLSLLKTEQDTVIITGVVRDPLPATQQLNPHNERYYRFTFYLNNYTEIKEVMSNLLPAKLATLETNIKGKWPVVLGTGARFLKAGNDQSISADQARGFTNGAGDYISSYISTNLQNYKSYFAPSFSLGARLTLVNRDKTFKREIGLFWEPHFFFTKSGDNSLVVSRNDFLSLSFAQGGLQDHDSRKEFSFHAEGSLGYLIHREGSFVDKHTFRLGLGIAQFSKLTIEPCMYFNNFFRGVSPGLRLSQRF